MVNANNGISEEFIVYRNGYYDPVVLGNHSTKVYLSRNSTLMVYILNEKANPLYVLNDAPRIYGLAMTAVANTITDFSGYTSL